MMTKDKKAQPTEREKVLNELFEGDSDDSDSSDNRKNDEESKKKDEDEFYKFVDSGN